MPLRVPDVFLAWAGHAILFVWCAVVLGLIAIVVSGPSASRFSWIRDPRTAPRVAAVLAVAVFLGVWLGQVLPPNGDEPHYLVIAQSLLLDHDVKVANNYARADYLSYYSGFLGPHLAPPGVDGERYSVHAPGLPAFVAPAFALGGYAAVVVWIAAFAALGTAFVWRAGYLLTRDAGAAWFGWAVVALTVPVVLHGTLVYPDPMAGVVLAGGALALVAVSEHGRCRAIIDDRGEGGARTARMPHGPDGVRVSSAWRSRCCPGCIRGWHYQRGSSFSCSRCAWEEGARSRAIVGAT